MIVLFFSNGRGPKNYIRGKVDGAGAGAGAGRVCECTYRRRVNKKTGTRTEAAFLEAVLDVATIFEVKFLRVTEPTTCNFGGNLIFKPKLL